MNRVLYTLIIVTLSSSAVWAQIEPGDFIANFESGNVANVRQINTDEFTFEIRRDVGPSDTYGWYYFAIAGDSGRIATLYLTNPDGWQNETCAPLYSTDNRNWNRVADVWREGSWVGFSQILEADTVWFAQDFPYTVSQFYAYLDSLDNLAGMRIDTLGYSVHSRPIKMLALTDPAFPDENKKTVWLISRQHPMESPASFLLKGLLDEVTSGSLFAHYWKQDIILKVVPIVNVDGVAEGYSRQNARGVNLNRDWGTNFEQEEPEVRAVHQALDSYIASGRSIDIFMDLHAAPDNNDFGYRMSLSYTSPEYFASQEGFLHLLETCDHWQDRTGWRDLDTNYAFGVSCVVAYDMYGLDTYSSELPWTRRDDGSFITIPSLQEQGPEWGAAIYNYLFPLTVMDEADIRMDSIEIGESFVPKLRDYDQRTHSSLTIIAQCPQTGDSETVTLYRLNNEGQFAPRSPILTNGQDAVPGDSILSLSPRGQVNITYVDPDLELRVCTRILPILGGCDYIAGDVNANGQTNGVDVIYLVNFFKGGTAPPLVCDCPPHGALYAGADTNGDCGINGLDVSYLVNYFKGGEALSYCLDCPPR